MENNDFLETMQTNGKKQPDKKPKMSKKKKATIIISSVVAALLVVAAVVFFVLLLFNMEIFASLSVPETYMEGVTIEGVEVGGMSKEEAKTAVTAACEQTAENLLFTLKASREMEDVRAKAEEYRQKLEEQPVLGDEDDQTPEDTDEGQEGGVGFDPDAEGEGVDEPVETEEPVESEEPQMPDVTLISDAQGNYLVGGSNYLSVIFDIDAVLDEAMLLGTEGTKEEKEALAEKVRNHEEGQYTVPFTATLQEEVKEVLEAIALEAGVAPMDATMTVDYEAVANTPQGESPLSAVQYQEEIDGLDVDVEALYTLLQQKAEAGEFGEVEMPTVSVPAATTVDQLKGTIVLRSKFTTSFKSSNSNRSYNVTRAASLVNGKVLQPGEILSVNDCLGKRTLANGWKMAGAYQSGETVEQAGGGVCQVSTTMYNAVVKADLEIVYRQNHSMPVTYVDEGLDATINSVGNIIDFKWKNNTNSPIIVIAYTVDKMLTIELYGEAFSGEYDEIRLTSERIGTVAPKGDIQYVVDPSKPAGYSETQVARKNGSKWQSYKHYYKDGELVKTEPLDTSTYKAFAGKVIVGALPASTEPVTQTPATQIPASQAPPSTQAPASQTPESQAPPSTDTAPPSQESPPAA